MEISSDNWERAKRLFDAALDLDPSRRSSFLADNCPDAALRQQIEQLLLNYQKAGNLLDNAVFEPTITDPGRTSDTPAESTPPLDSADLSATATSADSQDPLIGRQLSTYKLIRRIGRGGMAAVYLAARADDERNAGRAGRRKEDPQVPPYRVIRRLRLRQLFWFSSARGP